MNDDKYLAQAKGLIADCLLVPMEHISDDAQIGDLRGLDSMMFEGILLAIEEHIGAEIDVMDIVQLRTVRDVAHVLAAHAQAS